MTRSSDRSFQGRFWSIVKILNVRLRFILLMVLTGLIAANWEAITNRWDRIQRGNRAVEVGEAEFEYYCGMHPSVVRSEPGSCPICGMPLSKRKKGEAPALPEGTIARAELSPSQIAMAGVATSPVGFHRLSQAIRVAGTVEPDERRVARIAARVEGRIERLFADATGEVVGAGERLAEIYSPPLVTTQREYLASLERQLAVEGIGDSAAIATFRTLRDAARERLRLWGIDKEQIAILEQERAPRNTLLIRSPIAGTVTSKDVVAGQYVMEGTNLYTVTDLSRVWMIAYVPENEISLVRLGQKVTVAGQAFPGRPFPGEVSFLYPTVDPATRTLPVRVEVQNPDGSLRPGMFVNATIDVAPPAPTATASTAAAEAYICTMCPEVHETEPGECPVCGMDLVKTQVAPAGTALAIPASAVIDTGTRRLVYLEREPGVFDAIEVKLGPLSGDHYPVLEGLVAEDRIVTSGAFLVDAEVRLNPAAAGTYFGARGTPVSGAGNHSGH